MADVAIERGRQEGLFTTSRATAPTDFHYPVRANQAMKVDQIPRSFTIGKMPNPRKSAMVEDEATSLAREHGCPAPDPRGDEPKCPGEPCQEPLLIEVSELKSNPERRYVLFKQREAGYGENDDGDFEKVEVQANIGVARRPSVSSRVEKGADSKPTELTRPKSRLDLPRIDTGDVYAQHGSTRPRSSTRSRSSYRDTRVTQEPRDYFDHVESPRPQLGGMETQSPVVIKHSTRGRHRAYFDLYPTNNPGPSRSQPPVDLARTQSDRPRTGDRFAPKITTSTSPAAQRRIVEDAPTYSRTMSDRSPITYKDLSNPRSSKQSISSLSSVDGKFPASPRRDRFGSSPPQDLPYLPLTSDSSRTREKTDYSSDDEPRSSRRSTRRKSFRLEAEDRNALLSPMSATGSLRDKSRTRMSARSPSASHRLSRGPEELPAEMRPVPLLSPRLPAPPIANLRDRRLNRQDSPPPSRSPSPTQSVRSRDDRPRIFKPITPAVEYGSLPIRTPVTPGPSSTFEAFSQPSPRPPPSPRTSVDSALSQNHPPPMAFTRADSALSVKSTSRSKQWRSYLDYARDVAYGKIDALPDCPRTTPTNKPHNWYTFANQPSLTETFSICSTCRGAMFPDSRFSSQLVPAHRSSRIETACSVGNSHWFRIAWVLTKTHKLNDLRLLHDVAKTELRRSSCPGHYPTRREWFSIINPATGRPVTDFSVCRACTDAVGALLPRLKGAFKPTTSDGAPTRDSCALRGYPETSRFVRFFDALEQADDRTLLADKRKVDAAPLAKQLKEVASFGECNEDCEVDNRSWHVMRSIPDFCVCEECFLTVVRPQIAAGNVIAGDFEWQPTVLKRAACQLYSRRMRGVFETACERGDMGFLADRVRERAILRERLQDVLEKERRPERLQEMLLEWARYE